MKKAIEKRKRIKRVVEYSDFNFLKRMITQVYPSGIFSVISDTIDYWRFISEYVPRLKNDILARNGKVVIRADSGDPVEVICGKDFIDLNKIIDSEKEEVNIDLIKEVSIECSIQDIIGTSESTKINEIFVYDNHWYRLTGTYECDSWDSYWNKIEFKEIELSAEEKGSIELLWEIFGGTVNDKGYKELDPHIGLIYGDSITVERTKEICRRLEAKGFASTNVVLGIGSYTYTYVTRDTFGMAVKATYCVVNGKGYPIFKSPKGDSSKKSHKGIPIQWKDGVTDGHSLQDLGKQNLYRTYFIDGIIPFVQPWFEVKQRAMTNEN